MTNETIIEIGSATLRRRWRAIFLLCVMLFPIAIFVLRVMDFPYTAKITLLALPQQSNNIFDGGSGNLFGGGSALDRMTMLTGQESLISSARVFEAVKLVDPDLSRKNLDPSVRKQEFGKFIGKMQEFIFGAKYVEVRQKWKNREFALFKHRIGIKIDQDNATVQITYRHPDPKVAIECVKKAANELEQINGEIAKTQAAKKVAFLSEKMANARAENDRVTESITSFARKNRFSGDAHSVEPRYKGLSEANELITKARLEISKREEAVIEVKKASDRIQKEINQGLISNREGRLKNLMNELRVYEQAIARSSDSDKVGTTQALKKQLAQVRSKIAQEVERGNGKMEIANLQSLLSANEANLVEQESALRAARKQLEYGESQAKKFERQLSAIPELSADLSKLTLVQTQQRKLLELLTQRYLEAQIESDTKIDQFYVTETATLVDSEKLGKLPILLSLLAVITIAVLCAVVMYDLAKGVILTKQQLLRFQLPHYAGAVPFASELRNRHADTVVNEIGVGFRLAHILKRHLFEDAAHGPAKVVAVTSKTSRVGKTVTSLGVATAMQSRGLKTLVVDVDYLAKGRALRNQISGAMHHVTRVEHLVSGPGPVPLNLHKKQKLTLWSISEEFDTEESITNFFVKDFSGILENLKSQYDCIIIDCAPCFVSTMLIVYEQADLTVLCFAEGVSTVDDVASATELIAPACKDGAKIYSALTIARLKSNAIAARGSDGFYYKSNRAA